MSQLKQYLICNICEQKIIDEMPTALMLYYDICGHHAYSSASHFFPYDDDLNSFEEELEYLESNGYILTCDSSENACLIKARPTYFYDVRTQMMAYCRGEGCE